MNASHEVKLPLTPISMAILTALAEGDRHGYSLMQEVEAQTDGVLKPGTGSLYAALQRLMDDGLIAESATGPAPDEDQRRKCYSLTDLGRAVAVAEADRLRRVLEVAVEKKLVPTLPWARRSDH